MQKLFATLILMLLSVQTQAAPAKVQSGGLVEIFVASELAQTPQWKQTICADLQSHVNSLPKHRFDVRCTLKTADEVYELSKRRMQDVNVAATFTLIEDMTADLRLTYNQTVVDPDLEFSSLAWRISMINARSSFETRWRSILFDQAVDFRKRSASTKSPANSSTRRQVSASIGKRLSSTFKWRVKVRSNT